MKKGSEPYLCAKLNVCRNNRDFNDGDDTHQTHHAQKSKCVVITTLILPQAPEYKEQFDKNHSKGNQTGKQDAVNPFRVPRFLRNVPRGAVRFRGVFKCQSVVETVPAPDMNKW